MLNLGPGRIGTPVSLGDRVTLDAELVKRVVMNALAEDVGAGDLTSEATVPQNARIKARAIARESGILAGIDVFRAVFDALSEEVRTKCPLNDGERFSDGATLAEVAGNARRVLAGERVALNFLQRMCGIATETARYVAAVDGTTATILDTRKTVPGLRILDKYAVRSGGGANHRIGLFDGILIKDNHIAAAGSITEAVSQARGSQIRDAILFEVECETLDQVSECLALGVGLMLLDNMPVEEMSRAVRMCEGRARLEASGNISLQNVRETAETGVDFISIGSLTRSVAALDIGLDILPVKETNR